MSQNVCPLNVETSQGCADGAKCYAAQESMLWRASETDERLAAGFYIYIPARTAQGGGGRFKDRKPIGEVGCCDAWMAEQIHLWIEMWFEHRQIYRSTCLSN